MEKRLAQMSKHKWAAIVYGRSYQVDFRFITLPEDFTEQKKDWAAQYILATLNHANKLSGCPRWSLFKDRSHCVIGVTCMVRDLLQNTLSPDKIELLSKDNQGRPLYVFVGYVTQINSQQALNSFPAYTNSQLQSFQNLYQYIIDVWQVEEYVQDSKKPLLNKYQSLNFERQFDIEATAKLASQINHQHKDPQHIYLWQNDSIQKQNLWATAAVCQQPISLCLGESNLRKITQNPFLNQIITDDSFTTLKNSMVNQDQSDLSELSKPKKLPQIIISKVKKDLEITLQSIHLLKNKSQSLLSSFSTHSTTASLSYLHSDLDLESSASDFYQDHNFGFKAKSSMSNDTPEKDWF